MPRRCPFLFHPIPSAPSVPIRVLSVAASDLHSWRPRCCDLCQGRGDSGIAIRGCSRCAPQPPGESLSLHRASGVENRSRAFKPYAQRVRQTPTLGGLGGIRRSSGGLVLSTPHQVDATSDSARRFIRIVKELPATGLPGTEPFSLCEAIPDLLRGSTAGFPFQSNCDEMTSQPMRRSAPDPCGEPNQDPEMPQSALSHQRVSIYNRPG